MQIFFSPTLWLWIFIECVQLRNDKTLPNNLSIGKTEAFIGRYNACKLMPKRGNCTENLLRYFYDKATAHCRRFIYSGCGGNENCFKTRFQCEKYCMKRKSSIRWVDHTRGKCRSSGKIVQRYYYDHLSEQCKMFWYRECPMITTDNANIFLDQTSCEASCIRRRRMHQWHKLKNLNNKPNALKQVCYTRFNSSLRKLCKSGVWEPRFFYNATSLQCEPFWYDESCGHHPSPLSNIFRTRHQCSKICELKDSEVLGLQKWLQPKTVGKITAMLTDGRNIAPVSKLTDKMIDTGRLRAFIRPVLSNRDSLPKNQVKLHSVVTISSKIKRFQRWANNEKINKLRNAHNMQKYSLYNKSDDMDGNLTYPISFINTLLHKKPNETDGIVIHPITFNFSKNHRSAFDDKQFSMFLMKQKNEGDCFAAYDINLTRSCGNGEWKQRYYFDGQNQKCQMFWNDGCQSLSGNNFEDLVTCQWLCEKILPNPKSRACLDPFDSIYLEECSDKKNERFYFNQEKKICERFLYSGCLSISMNIFADYGECQNLCENREHELTRSCLQPFDSKYEELCSTDGSYRIRYYYDISTKKCRLFWYGGCKASSENIFSTLAICKWACEREVTEAKEYDMCVEKFDVRYMELCNDGQRWIQKWYFNQTDGQCVPFWYGGCITNAQNIFDDEKYCEWLCKTSDSSLHDYQSDSDRCLDELMKGMCNESYSAYFYNKQSRRCEPFAYSGCGGNGNRFLTLAQCENTCKKFEFFSAEETDCFLRRSVGYSKINEGCRKNAGIKYYYDRKNDQCKKFWYHGCGGNANRYYSFASCSSVCQNVTSKSAELTGPVHPIACFASNVAEKCLINGERNLMMWYYDSASGKCRSLQTFAGCANNKNYFANEHSCSRICKGMAVPNSVEHCAYFPDWGPCNQLHYVWFFNLTIGACQQFLYGGCGGNPNRFDTFEYCQQTCEVPQDDVCNDPLDRGNWCEPMTNRYYYNKETKSCKGFHYTGCGKSANRFLTVAECEENCIRGRSPTTIHLPVSSLNAAPFNYRNKQPPTQQPMNQAIILSADTNPYFKTVGEWVKYGHCIGFRYNISGINTLLKSFLCRMEEEGSCQLETFKETNGEERCYLVRPWLRDIHYYSWFWIIERIEPKQRSNSHQRFQNLSYTNAVIIPLSSNACYDAC